MTFHERPSKRKGGRGRGGCGWHRKKERRIHREKSPKNRGARGTASPRRSEVQDSRPAFETEFGQRPGNSNPSRTSGRRSVGGGRKILKPYPQNTREGRLGAGKQTRISIGADRQRASPSFPKRVFRNPRPQKNSGERRTGESSGFFRGRTGTRTHRDGIARTKRTASLEIPARRGSQPHSARRRQIRRENEFLERQIQRSGALQI